MKTNEHSEGKLTHLAENWFLARDVKPRRWQFFSRQDVDASQDHLDTSRPRPQPCISVGHLWRMNSDSSTTCIAQIEQSSESHLRNGL